jgi:hypothetical protein
VDLATVAFKAASDDVEKANRIALLEALSDSTWVEFRDISDSFVPECYGFGSRGLDCHDIGVTEGGRGHLHEELILARLGDWDFVHDHLLLSLIQMVNI